MKAFTDARAASACALLWIRALRAGLSPEEVARLWADTMPVGDDLDPCRAWTGGPVVGKTLLLDAPPPSILGSTRTALVGHGDALQALRGCLAFRAQGARVLVRCSPLLHRLFRSCPGIDGLFAEGAPPPTHDWHIPIGGSVVGGWAPGLPAAPPPHLSAEPALSESWRTELAAPGLRVGLVWHGALYAPHPAESWKQPFDARAVPLRHFAPLARVPGVSLFCLQKGDGREQLGAIDFPLVDLAPRLEDFADTAAVLSHLDILVTTDTAPAHLGGALGVPTWLVLPDLLRARVTSSLWGWREPWERGVERSELYPSVWTWRQGEGERWPALFARMAKELTRLAAAKGSMLARMLDHRRTPHEGQD